MKRPQWQRQILAHPHGGRALRVYERAQAAIGPLTYGFADLLLDNLESITQAEANQIAALYKSAPHVARALQRETRLNALANHGAAQFLN